MSAPERPGEAGLRVYESGDFTLAIARFAEVIAEDAESVSGWSNLGNAFLSAGDPEAAAGAYARALALAPDSALLHHHLGVALRRSGDAPRAAAHFLEAISLGLVTAQAFNDLGLALADDGQLDDAEAAYHRALALDPRSPAILVNLGNALGDAADPARARACYEAALALDPTLIAALLNLFALVHDDADPAPAERILDRILALDPAHPSALFHRGALRGLREGHAAAAPDHAHLPPSLDHLRTSFEHVLAHSLPTTRLFTDGFRLLDHALAAASIDGLLLELGVRRGASIRFLAARCPTRTVHGFDSFEGLPEDWRGVPRGAYSTRGELPAVPDNVVLHRGWFRDTLPPFLAAQAGPIRFLNVDCDLYASTRDALAVLAPRLVPGSVVVFDEYLANPGWEEDEHRALVEAARAFGFGYDLFAVSFFSKQAAIVVR
ncbi:MAG: protein arginine N-methyltransferase [Minicystis sp.]